MAGTKQQWPKRPPVRLQTLELNPAFIDDRLLGAMARAGFVGVGVTAESAADPALAGMRKGFTADQVERAAAAIRRSPLPCLWIFMLGGPGETSATVMESLRFAQRTLRPTSTSASASIPALNWSSSPAARAS